MFTYILKRVRMPLKLHELIRTETGRYTGI